MDTDTSERLLATGEWRQWVVDEVRTWLNTPYVHRGRIKGVAADCGGLLYETYNPLFHFQNPFPTDYSPDWALHRDDERYLDFIQPYVVPVPRPVFGGFSVFKMGRAYAHGAIYIGNDSYIHAWGRQRSGAVMQSKSSFFVTRADKARPAKHFDLRMP